MNATRGLLHARRAPRRGSVYVVVVAGLALLGLVTLTLSYTAQMEEQASRNWSEGIQARIAAVTGVPLFDEEMTASAPQTAAKFSSGPIDPRAPQVFQSASTRTGLSPLNAENLESFESLASGVRRLGLGTSLNGAPKGRAVGEVITLLAPSTGQLVDHSGLIQSGVAYHRVEDESAKINLNAVVDAEADLADTAVDMLVPETGLVLPDPLGAPSVRQFGALIDAVLKARGVAASSSGEELARALVAYRNGPDGLPGQGGQDDNLNGTGSASDVELASSDLGGLRLSAEVFTPAGMNADGRDNDRDAQIDEEDESIDGDGRDNDFDGEIDEAGEGIDEPEEFGVDIRLKARGDDRPFARLENLQRVPGFTPEIVEAIAPFVTVFSASRSGSSAAGAEPSKLGLVSLDPNTATAEEIFALLRAHYPALPEELLGQFVANLIDRRDQDDVPSELTLGNLGEPYIGIEVTPYINEVCPDVSTFPEDGDDGQFVELINPYTRDFDLTGWRIETGTSTVYLRGVIPAGGMLVVTDDYDDSEDPEPEEEPGYGSLYDVFGVVPVGLDRLIQATEVFDLNDDQGIVKLYSNHENLVDSFGYTDGGFSGANLSFQRIDPRVRSVKRDLATPLAHNPGYSEPTEEEKTGLAVFEALQNQPVRTALELLLVSTSYAGTGEEAAPPRWRFPSLHAGASDNLDVTVVDLFQPGAPLPVRSTAAQAELDALLSESREAQEAVRKLLAVLEQPPAFFGRININTAAPGVLAVLPGVGGDFARQIAELRGAPLELGDDFARLPPAKRTKTEAEVAEAAEAEAAETQDSPEGDVPVLDEDGFRAIGFGAPRLQAAEAEPSVDAPGAVEDWFIARSPQSAPRWRTLSEFIRDRELWADASLLERIERTYRFSGMIAFQSLAYKVTTANIPQNKDDASGNARASVMYAERLLAADRGALETVVFRYGPHVASGLR